MIGLYPEAYSQPVLFTMDESRFLLSPRGRFVQWVVRELHLEVTLLAKGKAEPERGIDASSLSQAERLERIKPLAEGAIQLWQHAKQGVFEEPGHGLDKLTAVVNAFGPRYAAMLSKLPEFQD